MINPDGPQRFSIEGYYSLPPALNIPERLRKRPELIIPLIPCLTEIYTEQMRQGVAGLPEGLISWMETQLAKPQTETQINYDNLHQVFRTIVPDLTFLPDETAIHWGEFREFLLPQASETLIVQPYTILPLDQSLIFEQTQRIASITIPDPSLFAVRSLNPTEKHFYARLIEKSWQCSLLAASFRRQSSGFYKQAGQAVEMLSRLAETISQVVSVQTKTINLSSQALGFLLWSHYLNAGEALIAPLKLLAKKKGLKLPEL